jgi:protein TonB
MALMQWLTKNLRYPPAARQRQQQGRVVTQFIVNTDGSLSDMKVVQSAEPSLDREALRVLHMMPAWKPGQQDNKPCRTMVCIPIVFKL